MIDRSVSVRLRLVVEKMSAVKQAQRGIDHKTPAQQTQPDCESTELLASQVRPLTAQSHPFSFLLSSLNL